MVNFSLNEIKLLFCCCCCCCVFFFSFKPNDIVWCMRPILTASFWFWKMVLIPCTCWQLSIWFFILVVSYGCSPWCHSPMYLIPNHQCSWRFIMQLCFQAMEGLHPVCKNPLFSSQFIWLPIVFWGCCWQRHQKNGVKSGEVRGANCV